MICEHHLTIPGAIRDHLLKVRFDFAIGRPAPRAAGPDDPRFSDPGEPGQAAVMAAWMLRPGIVEGQEPRARRLPEKIVRSLREDQRLEQYLWTRALEALPND